MARGYKTGGRMKGTKNRKTEELEAQARELVDTTLGSDAFSGDAHEFLQLVYKNEKLPLATRIDAARSAIRYEKPALMSALPPKADIDQLLRCAVPDVAGRKFVRAAAPPRRRQGITFAVIDMKAISWSFK